MNRGQFKRFTQALERVPHSVADADADLFRASYRDLVKEFLADVRPLFKNAPGKKLSLASLRDNGDLEAYQSRAKQLSSDIADLYLDYTDRARVRGYRGAIRSLQALLADQGPDTPDIDAVLEERQPLIQTTKVKEKLVRIGPGDPGYQSLREAFDPNQPRDRSGRWSRSGSSARSHKDGRPKKTAKRSRTALLTDRLPPSKKVPARGRGRNAGLAVSPDYFRVPTSKLAVDPERFQFRSNYDPETGNANRLADSEFNPALVGALEVWRDPKDKRIYVVNGHNRFAKGKEHGMKRWDIRLIKAKTDKEARVFGALRNVAENNATPLDIAKLGKETGVTLQELAKFGVSPKSKLARTGLGIAGLSDPMFRRVVVGELPEEHAGLIGSELTDPQEQDGFWSIYAKSGGPDMRDDEVLELIRMVKSAPVGEVDISSPLLPGMEDWATRSLVAEKAKLAAAIRRRLNSDRNTFKFVGSAKRQELLAQAGNKLAAESNEAHAEAAAKAFQTFSALVHSKGPINEALNAAARKMAADNLPAAAVLGKGTYDDILEAIRRELDKDDQSDDGSQRGFFESAAVGFGEGSFGAAAGGRGTGRASVVIQGIRIELLPDDSLEVECEPPEFDRTDGRRSVARVIILEDDGTVWLTTDSEVTAFSEADYPVGGRESFFAVCDRDERGWCVSSGGAEGGRHDAAAQGKITELEGKREQLRPFVSKTRRSEWRLPAVHAKRLEKAVGELAKIHPLNGEEFRIELPSQQMLDKLAQASTSTFPPMKHLPTVALDTMQRSFLSRIAEQQQKNTTKTAAALLKANGNNWRQSEVAGAYNFLLDEWLGGNSNSDAVSFALRRSAIAKLGAWDVGSVSESVAPHQDYEHSSAEEGYARLGFASVNGARRRMSKPQATAELRKRGQIASDSLVQAMWVTAQEQLAKQNKDSLTLYRTVFLPADLVSGSAGEKVMLRIRHRAVSSFTADPDVANLWETPLNTPTRRKVVIKAVIPRQAILATDSQLGSTIEKEFMVLGMPWRKVEAFVEHTPDFRPNLEEAAAGRPVEPNNQPIEVDFDDHPWLGAGREFSLPENDTEQDEPELEGEQDDGGPT